VWVSRARPTLPNPLQGTERFTVGITIQWYSVLNSARTPAILVQVFNDFPPSLQSNSRIVSGLGHDHFQANSVQCNYVKWALESANPDRHQNNRIALCKIVWSL
jgi:hypothetical protein